MTDTTGNAELIRRARIKSGMIAMGERIEWGSETALMDELADALEAAERVIADIRPEVLAFAHLMERELRNNDHKSGWKDAEPDWLANRVFEEAQELCDLANSYEVSCMSPVSAVDRDAVAGEAADVANMAMMVADVCGCLDDYLRPPPAGREPPMTSNDVWVRERAERLAVEINKLWFDNQLPLIAEALQAAIERGEKAGHDVGKTVARTELRARHATTHREGDDRDTRTSRPDHAPRHRTSSRAGEPVQGPFVPDDLPDWSSDDQ